MCTDVAKWAEEHLGREPIELFPPRRIERKPPNTVEPANLSIFTERLEGCLHGRYLVPINGARVVGRSGIVVLPDNSYSVESVIGLKNLVSQPDYYAPRRRPTVEKQGDYFLLLEFMGQGHYYHWLHDTVSRLFRVREHLPNDTRFVVPPSLTDLQRETLDILGVEERQRVNFNPDEVWELETLHFAPAPTNSGVSRTEIDVWLRDSILDAYGITPSPSGRRIFMSRSRVPNRRLVNEIAVVEFLQPYGFEVVSPEALDLRGQAELFAGAEIVVSTHGSAFTNMLFAPPGLVVIDMLDPSMFTNAFAFWTMSEALGHEYWYFVIDNVDVAGNKWPDTCVPIGKLAETFAQIGLAPKP